MSLERWRRVDALFSAALDQPPESRRAFISTASGGDEELIAEVEALLASVDLAGDALAESGELLLGTEPRTEPSRVGQQLGAYRVLREIGRGGMGVVYLAERADAEYTRQVAIKVVRAGSSRERLARFRKEAQILASLEHPGIARLYDTGVTETGEPFLVMEYVDGVRVDRYADDHRLDVDARLALLEQVCDAVRYAHGRLVVHRDLKPSNILIAADGRPRLLDFGVAKLLADDGDPVTRPVHRMLTPEYAAPEQIRGLPVTVAADVYALGVILHELLIGRRPRRPMASGPGDGAELPPPAPSEALGEPADDRWNAPAAAAARGTSVASLRRRCRGDLDAITLTALAPDPAARYRSVESLRDDIRWCRERRPIAADPPGPFGRMARFVRRNPLLTVGSAALLGLVTVYQVTTITQRRTIQAERDRAEQVTDFLVRLFSADDPIRGTGRDTLRVGDFIAEGAARAETELADQAPLQAALFTALGRAQLGLGNLPEARRLLERAVARRGELRRADLAASLTVLGLVAQDQGEFAEAEALNREALEIRRRDDPSSRTENLANLGILLMERGQLDSAALLLDRALTLDSVHQRADSSARAEILNKRSAVAYRSGQLDRALTLSREALELLRGGRDSTHPRVLGQQANLAFVLDRSGRSAEAVELLRPTLVGIRDVLPGTHPLVRATMTSLANALRQTGRGEEAAELLGEVVDIERIAVPTSPNRAFALDALATTMQGLGRAEEAANAWREALNLNLQSLGPEHRSIGLFRSRLANLACREPATRSAQRAAIPQFEESIALLARILSPADPMLLGARSQYGGCLTRMEAWPEARVELESAYRLARDSLGPAHPIRRLLGTTLSTLYEASADSSAAQRIREELRPDSSRAG